MTGLQPDGADPTTEDLTTKAWWAWLVGTREVGSHPADRFAARDALAYVDRLRAELADCRAAGDALADAAANLIVECARRTVAHQAVHTRDLTGWPPLEREVKAWRSGR